MTTVNNFMALAMLFAYQQQTQVCGCTHSTLTLGGNQVELYIFANTLEETIRYRRALINLGVDKKEIEHVYFEHDGTTKDFHTLTIRCNIISRIAKVINDRIQTEVTFTITL